MPTINEKNFSNYKKEYEKNGFVIIENVFNYEECDNIKKKSYEYAEPPDFTVALNLHRKSKFFFEIISSQSLVKLIKFIQNSDIDALNDQYLFKKANSKYGKQSWTLHQDNSYICASKGKYIILHIAIDKSLKENGGLIFLPKSHNEKILKFKHNKSWREEAHKDGITRPGQTIVDESE